MKGIQTGIFDFIFIFLNVSRRQKTEGEGGERGRERGRERSILSKSYVVLLSMVVGRKRPISLKHHLQSFSRPVSKPVSQIVKQPVSRSVGCLVCLDVGMTIG